MLYKSYIHLREATRKCTRHTRAFQKRKARYVNVHFRLCYYYENANMHYLAQSARQAKDFAKYPPLEFTATEKVNSKKSFARSNEKMLPNRSRILIKKCAPYGTHFFVGAANRT